MQGDQSAITYKVDKIRRNRLHKCTDFIERIIWYCVDRNETGTYLSVFKDLIAVKDGWSHAAHRY